MTSRGNGSESGSRSKKELEPRQRAEALFLEKSAQSPEDFETMSPEHIRRIFNELQIHQIELEMQNEELRRSQLELEVMRARYFDLYDQVPVGCCTVGETGGIVEANLTVAALWGAARNSLVGQPFSQFIFSEDQDIYSLRRKQLFETGEPQTFELRLVKNDGAVFWAHLTATVSENGGGEPVCRIALSNSPERKLLETYKKIGREVLQILNKPGDLKNSLQRVLTVLMTQTGVDAVGIRLQNGDDFPYFVQDGFSEDFLLTENTLLERTGDGGECRDKDGNVRLECTCGLVLSGRTDPAHPIFTQAGSCWLNDVSKLLDIPPGKDLRVHPRNQCIHKGYASMALVPIRSEDRIVGLIQLNDRRKGCFTLDTIELLEGIASHIGAALMHKQDRDVLREREERFRSIVENSSAGYFFIDCNGRFQSVNTAWLHLHKFDSPEEIIGHHFSETLVDSDKARANEMVEQVLAGGVFPQGEFTRRCKDNSMAWHTFSVSPVWQGGEVVGAEGFLIDITERKRVENELRKSEGHLRTLVQTIPDLIWLKDKNGVYLSCNKKFERFFGAKEADIVGKTDYDFVDAKLADFFIEHDRKAMAAGQPTSNEEWITFSDDGQRVLLETIKTPMFDSRGMLIGVLGIGRDITERKRAEDALQESEETVRKKLQAILEPEGNIGALELADIIDSQALQAMMEEFYRITKIGIGILDKNGKVLVGVGWQDVCTKFHRIHPETLKNCQESDVTLARGVPAGSFRAYRCKNNMWDIMTPIEISGRQLGNVCLGQFFYKDEPLDYTLFRTQAQKYGFDEAEYLAAIDRTPRWSRETVDAAMAFYTSLSKMISSLSYSKVKLARTLSQKNAALRQLDETRAFQDLLLETIPIPVFYKDIQGRYLGMNRACENFFGKSKQEFQGKNVYDIHPPELARIYHLKDAELFEKQGSQIYESKIMNVQGKLHDVIFHKASLTDANGSIIGLIGTILDITERKQAEMALRLSEERLQLTLNTSQIGIWDWNIKEDTWYASPIYYTMLGYEPIAGPSDRSVWLERVHPEDRNAVTRKIADVLQGGTNIYQYEARMRHADGSYKWHSVIGHAIEWDNDNIPTRLLGVRMNITERKLAEEENRKLHDQLQQAQKMEAVGQLAGGVAHDFNNMLGVILGHAEMAMDQVDSMEPLHADLAEILKAAHRSADLTRQLLAFARKQTVIPQVLNLNETVEGMLKMLRRLIGEDIDLAWLPAKYLWAVMVDPSQIDQILANLCINARDAISDVGKVTIETKNSIFDADYCAAHAGFIPGEYVMLALSDNGRGMDKETLTRIFEPFFTTKEMGKGTGLGLAMVYGIVRQNNGFINVYSEPGQGTTFTIYLPRHEGKATQPQEKVSAEASLPCQETILLVEDEQPILQLTKRMLEMQGYTVFAVSTPGEAIRMAEAHPGQIDLLMTDVVMPEMNGRDLAKKLSSLHPKLKCLFMSGYTANVIAHHGVLDPGIDFIQKPFSKKSLATKVWEVIKGKQV